MKKLIVVISVLLAASMFMFSAAVSAGSGSYLIGDTDGSGVVSIEDVTLIQKVLAELVADTDGSITKRGNVDGDELSISDATAVQMYIAGFRNDYNIGETAEEQVTTQAATQPTTRSYELPFIPIRR
ncbi:MAG: hypothetical protein IIV15_03835 [Ruminococcus sp.]|nr:hypothetical protein [Ruminococcus sp.]MBQ3300286.1 hypothetical protein [Ruminococcus sp.]MBQ5630419.1 hypothetical protein [Ruminococcus sp.]MDO4892272.1 hypothetical protein [Eubacteriales bacterium]MEE0843265.1 hypothetical protein [Ruminococcus sp.]